MVEFVIPEYDKAGDYVYTITEEVGDKGGITYDASVYEVTVTVTDNTVEGKLEAFLKRNRSTRSPHYSFLVGIRRIANLLFEYKHEKGV